MSSEKKPLETNVENIFYGFTAYQILNIAKIVVVEGTQIGLVGSIMAGILLPGDLILHQLQTKNRSEALALNVKGVTYAKIGQFLLHLAPAYGNAALASTKKSGIYTNRDNLSEVINSKNKEVTSEDQIKTPKKMSTLDDCKVASVLGTTETVLTQNNNLRKTHALEKATNPGKLSPKPITLLDKTKHFFGGFFIRVMKNSITVIGFLVQPKIKKKIDSYFPEQTNSEVKEVIASTISGIPVGLATNAADVINRKQVTEMDPNTFRTPSLYNTAQNLVVKNGPRVFFRGGATAVGYSVVAQYALPKAEKIANKIMNNMSAVSTPLSDSNEDNSELTNALLNWSFK